LTRKCVQEYMVVANEASTELGRKVAESLGCRFPR